MKARRETLGGVWLLLCLAGLGCQAPEPGPRRLLDVLQPADLDPLTNVGEPTSKPALERILVGPSERQALTTHRNGLQAELELPSQPIMRFSVAPGVPPEHDGSGAAEVTVSWIARGKTREIYRQSLDATRQWTDHRVALPDLPRRGRLLLSSQGAFPIAWSEVYLYPTGGERAIDDGRPNLVLILVDTLRADHMSSYGYDRPTTPNLDLLAAEGNVFLNSYSAATWTLPSAASLLTGIYPDQHGLQGIRGRLKPGAPTLARHLRAAGYRTVAFADGGFLAPRWGVGQGFERYDTTPGQAWEPKDVTEVTTAAVDWIGDAFHEPFLLMLHTYEAHQPYTNAEGFAEPFLDPGAPGPDSVHVAPLAKKSPGPREMRRMIALYDGGIRRADHYLGQFLEALRETGLGSRTAVLVTSDHGEEFFEHGNLEHGFGKVFDENVRVPLILKLPEPVPRRDVSAPVSGVDVAPTLLDLAGIEPPADLPGRSLLKILDTGEERPILIHGIHSLQELSENRLRLNQAGQALIHDRVRQRQETYDLTRDPGMTEPAGEPGPAPEAWRRLATIQAWSSEGQLLARLPAGNTSLAIPEDSRIDLQGIWQGLVFSAAVDGERARSLLPDRGSILAFDLRPGSGAMTVRLERDGTQTPETITLKARRDGGRSYMDWLPLAPEIPPHYAIFQTSSRLGAEAVTLLDDQKRELEALGYL